MTGSAGLGHGPRDLAWGIKPSFLSYLDGLGDSRIVTNGGVHPGEPGDAYVFPFVARTELSGGGVRLEFGGDLRLTAHGGMLLVIFMNPWLTMTPEGAELSVVDLMAWPDTSQRETIGISAGDHQESGNGVLEVPLKLAASGVETFNNVYPAGTELAPARLLHTE
ncbi:HtaA domain-containing protein [Georgenia sp. AZ-5]|uniref:HtaA domain-containing protein n=1 Tax=Georgenia sp. AZ-5 TaxID=3367526 RepID=UPI0037542DBC